MKKLNVPGASDGREPGGAKSQKEGSGKEPASGNALASGLPKDIAYPMYSSSSASDTPTLGREMVAGDGYYEGYSGQKERVLSTNPFEMEENAARGEPSPEGYDRHQVGPSVNAVGLQHNQHPGLDPAGHVLHSSADYASGPPITKPGIPAPGEMTKGSKKPDDNDFDD